MRIRLHPSFRELNRLADRELDEDRQRELHAHLGECQECRDQVALMRDMGRAAREISHPGPPEDSLSRILERRAAGDRVILPVTSALRASRQRKAIGIAAGIGGALLAATLLLLPANEASAGASDLRFDPAQPEPGDSIEVRYVPTSALAAEEMLYLRGAFRRPGDPPPRRGLPGAFRVELHQNDDGTFSGVVPMPSDVVFGYFAVENEAASELDLKDERFWPLLAHKAGVPTREALREQLAVIKATDVEIGLRAADMLLEYYPDDVVGWDRKLTYQRMVAVGAQLEDVVTEHRAKLAEFDRAWESGEFGDPTDLEALWRYARQLEDTMSMERWARELLRLDGRARSNAAARIRVEVELQGADTRQMLEVYEREWMLAGSSDDQIARQAFSRAAKGDDSEAVLRWARRLVRVRPAEMASIVVELPRFPSLAPLVMDGIRAEVRRLETPSPDRRALRERAEEMLARDRRTSSELLGTLGHLLFEEGRFDSAIDTLEVAVDGGWNPEALRTLADSYAAIGDDAQALRLSEYVVAGERDPEVRSNLRASLQRQFGPLFPDEPEWSRLITEAERRIARRRIAEVGSPIWPAGNPIVQTRQGDPLRLESLVTDRVAIVVFWTGSLMVEGAGLKDHQNELQALEAQDVVVITITETPQSTDLDNQLEKDGLALPVFYDREYEAARSLKVLGFPYLYVVDQQGRFYYAEDMAHAIRLAESFQLTAEATA